MFFLQFLFCSQLFFIKLKKKNTENLTKNKVHSYLRKKNYGKKFLKQKNLKSEALIEINYAQNILFLK